MGGRNGESGFISRDAKEMSVQRATVAPILRVKRPGVGADFPSVSGDEIKNDWSRTNYLKLINRRLLKYHQFNIQQFHVLPTQCIYVFCVDLRTNSGYVRIQYFSWLDKRETAEERS